LVETYYIPDPIQKAGYWYANTGTDLARTERDHWEVVCDCRCEGAGVKMHSRIYMFASIYLNKLYQTHSTLPGSGGQVVTRGGAYGHEQQHLVSVRREIQAQIIPALESAESATYETTEDCEFHALNEKALALLTFLELWTKERNHQNDQSPPDGDPRDPIDGVVPDGVPW
jgi:hypothetical protein